MGHDRWSAAVVMNCGQIDIMPSEPVAQIRVDLSLMIGSARSPIFNTKTKKKFNWRLVAPNIPAERLNQPQESELRNPCGGMQIWRTWR